MAEVTYSKRRRDYLNWYCNGVQRILVGQIVGLLVLSVAQLLPKPGDVESPLCQTQGVTSTITAAKLIDPGLLFQAIQVLAYVVATFVIMFERPTYGMISAVMTINALLLYASVTIVVNNLLDFVAFVDKQSAITAPMWMTWIMQFLWQTILTLLTASMVVISIVGMHGYEPKTSKILNNQVSISTKPSFSQSAARAPTPIITAKATATTGAGLDVNTVIMV